VLPMPRRLRHRPVLLPRVQGPVVTRLPLGEAHWETLPARATSEASTRSVEPSPSIRRAPASRQLRPDRPARRHRTALPRKATHLPEHRPRSRGVLPLDSPNMAVRRRTAAPPTTERHRAAAMAHRRRGMERPPGAMVQRPPATAHLRKVMARPPPDTGTLRKVTARPLDMGIPRTAATVQLPVVTARRPEPRAVRQVMGRRSPAVTIPLPTARKARWFRRRGAAWLPRAHPWRPSPPACETPPP
jgi:hypothetical protein